MWNEILNDEMTARPRLSHQELYECISVVCANVCAEGSHALIVRQQSGRGACYGRLFAMLSCLVLDYASQEADGFENARK
jgi:hypothetical protein